MATLDLATTIDGFNKTLKALVCDLVAQYPNDPVIVRAKKRVVLATGASPVYVIDLVGYYLYKFREPIYSGKDDFFLDQSYDKELKESKDSDQKDMVMYIIPKVKEAWRASAPKKKEEYKASVQSLLDWYLDYLALTAK